MLFYFVLRWERIILKKNEVLILVVILNMFYLSLRVVYLVIKYF